MFKQYKLRNYKFILVMYVVILNVIGILLIGSAKPSVQSKQIFGMIAGLTIMVMLSLIDYNFILKFSWLIYFFMVGVLLLVMFAGDDAVTLFSFFISFLFSFGLLSEPAA